MSKRLKLSKDTADYYSVCQSLQSALENYQILMAQHERWSEEVQRSATTLTALLSELAACSKKGNLNDSLICLFQFHQQPSTHPNLIHYPQLETSQHPHVIIRVIPLRVKLISLGRM